MVEGIFGAVGMSEMKERIAPPLTENERKQSDEKYVTNVYKQID